MKIEFMHRAYDHNTRHEVAAKITMDNGIVHRICADVAIEDDDEQSGIEFIDSEILERRRVVKYKRRARQLLRAKAIKMFSSPA